MKGVDSLVEVSFEVVSLGEVTLEVVSLGDVKLGVCLLYTSPSPRD